MLTIFKCGYVIIKFGKVQIKMFDIDFESERHSVVSDSLWPQGLYSPWNSPGQNTGVGSLSLLHGIFPTQGLNPGLPYCRQNLYQLSHKGSPRILGWVAYSFSRGSSHPGIKLRSPALQADSWPTEISGESESHSFVSNSLCPHGQNSPGTLQARILE